MKERKNVFIGSEDWKRLTALAKKADTSAGALIRQAIREFLEKQSKKA